MSKTLRTNKFFIVAFVFSILIVGMTFSNLPGPATSMGVQVVNGVTFNFADYQSVDHEILGLFNYLDTIVSNEYQDYGSWDGWYAENFAGLHHYVLAFMAYTMAGLFEATPGYRTDYYHDSLYDLIKKMNTTEAEWGENSIEYKEWTNPAQDFDEYYWPNATDTSGLYVGGFRGPANIMWTGHYALMMSLYERSFNTGQMTGEISWFVDDWNASLTTDGYGNAKEGGIWGTGIIPCEPFIVFVQCNSIPILTTELYDNMHGTNYMPMWDYGLNFINTVMQDQYDLFMDGYYVAMPTASSYNPDRLPPSIPGPTQDLYIRDGRCSVSSYCNGWALAFLEHTQESATLEDYPVFLEHFMKDLSPDMAYIMDSYNNPSGFGTYDILGTLFTMQLAKQMGDYVTRDRLVNFMYGSYNKEWSANGRELHFDTTSLEPFLQPVMAFGWIWANGPVSIKDLATPHTAEFWDQPFISAADDDNIWVYQAEWDPVQDAFILNIKVDQAATLTFSNFDSLPTAYRGGGQFLTLEAAGGGDYTLQLPVGTYQLVIM
jgi:hypothetical protein